MNSLRQTAEVPVHVEVPSLPPDGQATPGWLAALDEVAVLELRQRVRSTRWKAALIVCGVTTEVCVQTSMREANDRGYRCVVVSDACASYFPEFHRVAVAMISAQGGIFGWVATTATLVNGINRAHHAG